jgi:hypothetical protein
LKTLVAGVRGEASHSSNASDTPRVFKVFVFQSWQVARLRFFKG